MVIYTKTAILDKFENSTEIQGLSIYKFEKYSIAVEFISAVNATYTFMVQRRFSMVDDWSSKCDWNDDIDYTLEDWNEVEFH